jgi:hypothetical protein
MVEKVMSGFQTGADQAGVHAAYSLGIKTGGWIPRDRRSDDGQISMDDMVKYGLSIHAGNGYPPRTEQNVKDSDGTVLFGNMDSPGCKLTIICCDRHGKPHLNISSSDVGLIDIARLLKGFIETNDIKVLNVAGNRERTNPGIYQVTFDIVVEALK